MTVHLLTDGRALLEQQIDVDIEITSRDAPSHATDDLVKGAEAFDTGTKVASCYEQLQRLLELLLLLFVFTDVELESVKRNPFSKIQHLQSN